MKTLYLVRHAKSSWEESGLSDIDRPPTEQGIERTERVIRFLQKKEITADRILSSPAIRAYNTAVLVAKGIRYPKDKIIIDRKIYDGGYDKILDLICSTPDEINSLMIFGHNPAISLLADRFVHPGVDFLPTTGTVCIHFKTDQWKLIRSVEPVMDFIIFPKMLK
jgi:phosphohistidine phosphatase